jgi:hypothetical protein
MAQKQIAPTTMIIKIPIKTEIIMATSFAYSISLFLRLVDASVSKLYRPLGKSALAFDPFLWRRGGIDNLFDRLRGKLLGSQSPAGLASGVRQHVDPEPECDQAANGVRSGNVLVGR